MFYFPYYCISYQLPFISENFHSVIKGIVIQLFFVFIFFISIMDHNKHKKAAPCTGELDIWFRPRNPRLLNPQGISTYPVLLYLSRRLNCHSRTPEYLLQSSSSAFLTSSSFISGS